MSPYSEKRAAKTTNLKEKQLKSGQDRKLENFMKKSSKEQTVRRFDMILGDNLSQDHAGLDSCSQRSRTLMQG